MVDVALEAISGRTEASGDAPKSSAGGAETRRILPALRDITLVATIYLFFAGFLFRYFYFRLLGVSPNEIDLSLNSLLVFAFNVFLNLLWLPVAIVAALALFTVPKVRAVLEVAFLPLLACAAIGGFFVLYFGARATAERTVSIVRQGRGLPALFLKLRDDARYDQDFRVATGDAGRSNVKAFLVEQNASTYFVLVEHNPPDSARPGRLYAVPKSDVLYMGALLGAYRK